jgi:hypothetical protein
LICLPLDLLILISDSTSYGKRNLLYVGCCLSQFMEGGGLCYPLWALPQVVRLTYQRGNMVRHYCTLTITVVWPGLAMLGWELCAGFTHSPRNERPRQEKNHAFSFSKFAIHPPAYGMHPPPIVLMDETDKNRGVED